METSASSTLKLRAARYSLLTALTLAILKFGAGLLTGFLALCAWFALRALERYQRSL